MKKFIIIRFGFVNCTPDWFDYHIALWEALTLPTLELNADNETFIPLVVSEMIPLSSLRKLNEIINSSSARRNIYVLKYMVGFDKNEWSSAIRFINEHIDSKQNDEYFILHNLDGDDGLCSNFFSTAEEYVLERFKEQGEHKMVLMYPEGVAFSPNNLTQQNFYYEYMGMNYVVVTNNVQHASNVHSLHGMARGDATKARNHKFFIEQNFKEYCVKNGKINWFYTVHHGSSEGVLRRQIGDERNLRNGKLDGLIANVDFDTWEHVFGVDFKKILRFQKILYQPKGIGSYGTSNQATKELSRIRAEYDYTVAIYKELLDYNDIRKETFRAYVKERIEKSYTDALLDFFDLAPLKYNATCTINQGSVMLRFLTAYADNYRIFIVTSGMELNYCSDINRGIIKHVSESCGSKATMRCNVHGRGKDVWLASENGHSSIFSRGMELSLDLLGLNFLIMDNATSIIDMFNIDITNIEMPLIR